MKLSFALATTMLALSVATLPAQQQGGFGGPRGGNQSGGPRGGQGGFGGPSGQRGPGGRHMPPPHPLATALDVNNNYNIEPSEIEAAAENLLKHLDQNKDGRITADEYDPGPPGGGQFSGSGSGRGGPSGQGPQFGGPRGAESNGQPFGGPRGGEQSGQRGPRGGDQQFGGPQGRGGFGPGSGRGAPPPHPLGLAIDTDDDGSFSKEELAKASASLKQLDEDGDGTISHYEMRPKHGPGGRGRGGFGRGGNEQFGGLGGGQPPYGGSRGGRGQGQFGGPSGDQGGQGFGGQMPRGGQPGGVASGGFGGPNRPGPGGQRDSGQGNPVDRFMSLDRNGDGKVSNAEIPSSLAGLKQADTNRDGFITRAEATTFVNAFSNNRRNQRGPQGGRPGGSAGQQRPAFDQ